MEESLISCPFCGEELINRKKQLGIAFEGPAHSKARLTFVVLVSLYFSILLTSYLLEHFYPFFTPYGLLVIPVVANFFVGYLVREVDTAIKIIVACFFLHAGIVIGLVNVPSVHNAFYDTFLREISFMHRHMPFRWRESDFSGWIIVHILTYYIIHIPLGIGVSYVGITIRNNIRLLERSKKVKFLFVASLLLSMGIVSTWISSDFYRVEGEPTLWLGYTVKISYCGFPLPYLHFTNSSTITIFNIGESLGIQPFNYTNFLLDALFYVSIYSTITALGYTITRSKKTKKKLDEYLAIG